MRRGDDDDAGVEALRRYYREHLAIAERAGVGFILESATWRASRDWRDRLRERFPQLTVLGGCCGTDVRHVG